MSPLVGKFFTGVHDDSMRSGRIEAEISNGYFLIRFDTLIGFEDGTHWPESLSVAHLARMIGGTREEGPPAWHLFDNLEQRATYETWITAPELDRKSRVVQLRPSDVN